MATSETQLDNGAFRVTRWTIAPDDAIPMHHHEYEYVVVPLVDATMFVVGGDGSEIAAEIRTGQSYTHAAGAEHTVQNRGRDIISFVEIERLH